ncbi:MAG: ImmA/IrrE family metallo-endopeptidase [Bacillota bacterium]
MTPKIASLWKTIEREGIEVVYLPLRRTPERLKGVYLRDHGLPIILLDDQMGQVEHDCTLAHEVGHHFTTSGANILVARDYTGTIAVNRDEYRAIIWATNHMMPDAEVAATLRQATNILELADFFGVTPSFAIDKLRIFRHKLRTGGVKIRKFRHLLNPDLWEGWI